MVKHPPSDRAVFGLGTNSLSMPIGFNVLSTMRQLAAGGTPLPRSSERSPQVPGSERARPARTARFPGYLLPSCPGRPDKASSSDVDSALLGIPFNVLSRTIGTARSPVGIGELLVLTLVSAIAFVSLTKDPADGKPREPDTCTNSGR